jgi:TonB family protein
MVDAPELRQVLGVDWDWFNAGSFAAAQILELCYASGRTKAACDAEFDTNRHNMCRMEGLVARALRFAFGACDMAAEAVAKTLQSKPFQDSYDKLNAWFVAHSAPGSIGESGIRDTGWNNDGGGNAVYLDRHDVRCGPGETLTRFRLRRNPSQTHYRYEYSCSDAAPSVCQDRSTAWNDDGRGNAVYLDRHEVACGTDEALSSFRLRRDGGNTQYRYEYMCCSAPLARCRELDTGWNDDGRGDAVFLDRHDVACGADEALSRFRLRRNPEDQTRYRYEYTCCERGSAPDDASGSPYLAGVGGVTTPVLLHDTVATLPEIARRAGIEGNVILQAVIRSDGTVGETEILRCSRPNLGFEEQAVAAVRQWRYAPATRDGQPVDAWLTVRVDFRLGDAAPKTAGAACYWLNPSPNEWQAMPGVDTKQQCFALDSCNGGLAGSRGGCYKWATGPHGAAEPWN